MAGRAAAFDCQNRKDHDIVTHQLFLPSTLKRHAAALEAFQVWLLSEGVDSSIESLLLAPPLLVQLLCAFGVGLFRSMRPLYIYLYTLTALQHAQPSLRQLTQPAWALAAKWRAIEPTCHRAPIPVALFRAMTVLSIFLGWFDVAVVLMLTYLCPARIGEILRVTRDMIVTPTDLLQPELGKIFVRIAAPKTRFRGGAAVQHATLCDPDAVMFCSAFLDSLKSSDKIFRFGPATIRKRFGSLLGMLGIRRGSGFRYIADRFALGCR